MANKLTKQQEGFCQSYHKHGNAAQAYRENYQTKNMASKTVWENASRVLNNSKVSARIDELSAKVEKRHEKMTDKIIQEFANIAFANPADYYEWGPDGVRLKDSSELTKEQLSAIAGATETVTQFGGTIKVVMNSKIKALDSLARIFGMNQDSITVKGDQKELAEQAEKARERLKAISGTKK